MPQFQRIGPVFATLVGLVSASLSIGAPAFAADKLGVVLLHGEQGAPGIAIAGLAASLEKAGHLVSRPDMCWSARRADQVRFEECLAAIDTAIVRLRNLGASRIVVGGFGLGATAAIVYGAGHPGLQGIIALAPGHNAHALADDPDIAASIARAKALAAEGKGDTEASFEEIGIGPSGFYLTEIATTPEIYLSFFGEASQAVVAGHIEKLSAPLLFVDGSDDPAQSTDDAALFAQAPRAKLNRHAAVAGNRFGVPDAAKDIVKSWLDELQR